jgi:hypothetical protein
MKSRLNNKKADERLLSIYLFVIYIIVAIGIVSGVILFYGSPLEIRELEANLLSDKVIECLTDKGEIKPAFFNQESDLLKFCNFGFKENSQKYLGEEQYAVSVKIYSFDSCAKQESGTLVCTNTINSGIWGRSDFFEFCHSTGDKIPTCNIKQTYVLDKGDKVILEVISAIGKIPDVEKY